MAKRQRPHWQAPTTIITALVCAVLFAVGHHVFYSSLNGKAAHGNVYNILGSNVSAQQLNIAGGTALAFLVKAALGVALSVVFIQLFWQSIKSRSSQDVTLQNLDTIFDGLNNVFTLFKAWVWWRYPLMFLLALVAWLIPIASVITPATLSVVSAPRTEVLQQHVPNIDFRSLNYLAPMTPGANSDFAGDVPVQYSYAGPSSDVVSVVDSVTADGSITPIAPPQPNSTWTLHFPGPAIECSPMPAALRSAVQENVVQAVWNDCDSSYGYLAWTATGSHNRSLPFTRINNSTWLLKSTSIEPQSGSALYQRSSGPQTFYMAAMPNAMTVYEYGSHAQTYTCAQMEAPNTTPKQIQESLFVNATMIECKVFNVTYQTTFDYSHGDQSISTTLDESSKAEIVPIDWVFGPTGGPIQGNKFSHSNCSPLNQIGSYTGSNTSCYFNQTMLSTLSYQAISEAFFSKIGGSVYPQAGYFQPIFNTSIINTVLTNTGELHYLRESIPGTSTLITAGSYQAAVSRSNASLYQGLYKTEATPLHSLTKALEELFKRSVVSMASSTMLQPNKTSVFAPPPADVTVLSFHNVYAYSAVKLWIAYGIAIFITIVFVVIGLCVIATTRSSYSLSFSTVFRAARGAQLSTPIKFKDLEGRDSLPSYISRATVSFQPNPSANGKAKVPTKVEPAPLAPPGPLGAAAHNSLPQRGVRTARTL